MPKKDTQDIFIRGVDRATWIEFKYIADKEDKTATEKVKELIAETVKKGKGVK